MMTIRLEVTREQAQDLIITLDNARLGARSESGRRLPPETRAHLAATADRLDATYRALLDQVATALNIEGLDEEETR